jgi:hypothetical protein
VKVRRIGAIAAVAAILISTSPLAIADPAEAPAGPGSAISLADLGSQGNLSFPVNRDFSSTSVTFPVPPGLKPVQLTARLELPVELRSGNLAVMQGNRTISRQPLPAQDQAEMVIPLDGVEVSGNWVGLTMTMNALPPEGYCWNPQAPIRLADSAVTFAGGALPPGSVADFLPPVLRKVTIGIPGKPSLAESNAAVQLAASVANRNGQQPEITVVPLPAGADTAPVPAAPLERQIVVKEGPKAGLSVQPGPGGPVLRVSGPADQLVRQAQLVADDALRYAVSTGAAVETLPLPKLFSDTITIGEITGSDLTAEALWPRVGVEIDQTRWGHPIGAVSVHLIGSYTPLPGNFGGEVIASVGSEAVDRWPAEAAGTIDRTVTIPDRLLKRFSSLEVMVRTTGDPGSCGDQLPVMLRIKGATTITVTPAKPPVPQGFQSLPQALMPRIRIGIGDDALGDTVRAAQIMVGLQRASAVPLVTDVVPLQEAIVGTDPAVLISPGGWNDQTIALPFNAEQGRLKVTGVNEADESAELNLDPAKGFGSLQTVFDGQRTILVATSTGDPRQLDDLLRYLAAQPGRWAGLDGRAIISTPGADPITVPNPPAEFTGPTADQTYQEGSWFWRTVAGIAAVAVIGAAVILWKARRRPS